MTDLEYYFTLGFLEDDLIRAGLADDPLTKALGAAIQRPRPEYHAAPVLLDMYRKDVHKRLEYHASQQKLRQP